MGNKSVFWTNTARSDLEAIIRYIAEGNVDNAFAVLETLETKAGSLVTNPGRGRVVPELSGLGVNHYRELVENPWRIIYRIESSNVLVVAVLDSRRDLASVLLQRLVRS